MTNPIDWIHQIYVKISEARQNGSSVLAVFDLDSTLFDVSPRSQQILQDFALDPTHVTQFHPSLLALESVQIQRTDWGIKNALIRHGLATQPHEFHEALKQYWIERFFKGDYLKHDVPIRGAVNFTNQLARMGVQIVYLSGRDQESMLEASVHVLDLHGFPQGEIALKPIKGTLDSLFKVEWFDRQNLKQHELIYFFENEPVNLYQVLNKHPRVDPVFVETTHSGESFHHDTWPLIRDFHSPLIEERQTSC